MTLFKSISDISRHRMLSSEPPNPISAVSPLIATAKWLNSLGLTGERDSRKPGTDDAELYVGDSGSCTAILNEQAGEVRARS